MRVRAGNPRHMQGGNMVLVGFMGCGKTAVGKSLAKLTGRRFADIDRIIGRKAGMSIASIFRKMGETRFRNMEHREVRALSRMHDRVVAVGGGAAVFTRNRSWLRKAGVVIYLRVPVPVLVGRLAGSSGRPLIASARGDRRALASLVRKLLGKREGSYLASAHLTVDGGRGAPQSVARRILGSIRDGGGGMIQRAGL